MKSQHKQLIVLSAPSGGGKTTVAKHLFTVFPQLTFSVSATTRHIRPGEVDGKDYYFLSHEEFQQKILAHAIENHTPARRLLRLALIH